MPYHFLYPFKLFNISRLRKTENYIYIIELDHFANLK